jgi:hypothetical protein
MLFISARYETNVISSWQTGITSDLTLHLKQPLLVCIYLCAWVWVREGMCGCEGGRACVWGQC